MALINTKRLLSFTPGGSTDVVGHFLRVVKAGDPIDYTVEKIALGTKTTDIDLGSFAELSEKDDVFDLYVTSVDDAGNESDMLPIKNVALDFLAPAPPTAGQVN